MSMTLVLFDVDGTLLRSGGATTRCIRRAAERVLGDRLVWGEIAVGTLDQEIFCAIAAASGMDGPSLLDEYKRIYLDELAAELNRCRADVHLLPGVLELLDRLRERAEVVCGLLTGNFRRAVELKLDAAGLDISRFAVGAFAEDGACRAELVPAALGACQAKLGLPIPANQVILVGDTPRDIQCAREAGCRVLSVATGRYSLEELQAQSPDAAVADLRDPRPLEDLITTTLE